MYFIIADEDNSKNPVNQLVIDLIYAKERGVDVRVFLENTKLSQNRIAYQKLTHNGIQVKFDTSKYLLHTKTIIIDNRYCIIGSTNWTRSAIETNYETSILIDSEQLALSVKEYFSGMETTQAPPLFIGISIPDEFLLNKELGPKIFKDHAQKALCLYLLLLKESQLTGLNTITFNYRDIALQLGYPELDPSGYYLKLRKPFRLLKREYHLINYHTLREKKVTLLPIESTQSFILPYVYWDYNYSKSLSFKAKYVYLISLLETYKNKDYPFWFKSNKSLSSIYHISTNPISLGFLELERENIIEITRSKAVTEKYEDRAANIYQLNPLISQEEFNSKIDELNQKYSSRITKKARYLASQFNEPRDIEKIKTFIALIKKHTYPKVLEAVKIAATYKKGTGLHSIETVYTLLQTL